LHDSGHHLAVDGPPIYDASSQAWYQWKYEELAPLVDSVVMMVYDNQYDSGVGTSIAPKGWSLDCMKWLKRTTGDKGVAGVAAYGYSGDKQSGRIAVNSSEQIRRRVGSLQITRNADGELVASNGHTFYSFADEETLKVRLSQVKQTGIDRLSVWSLGDNPWFSR
jgi:spore germination protein YaaH